MSLTLVIGGVRSGKSARGEALAIRTGLPVSYIATADPADESMAQRIGAHLARRPAAWSTVVAGVSLREALRDPGGAADRASDAEWCVLLDGLGVWIARAMHSPDADSPAPASPDAGSSDAGSSGAGSSGAGSRDAVRDGIDALVATAVGRPVIVVAEEAGLGLLPNDPIARRWLDLLGEAVQRLSAAADHVELIVAGRPVVLTTPGPPAGGRASTPPCEPAVELDTAGLRHHGDTLVRPGDADHAVNVLAGGPPRWLRSELRRALDEGAGAYPDETEATASLAALHGRDPAEIVPTNGASQAMWLLPAAFRPRLAACVHPGFTEGEAALRAHGIEVVRVLRDPDRGFQLDPTAVPEAADLVLVGNPASPSGTLDPAAAVLALRRPGRTIVVDEAFMDLVAGEAGSLVRERLDDVIVLRSLTKSLAMPGLRVGYAVAAHSLAQRLRSVRPAWSVNVVALAALAAVGRRPNALAEAGARATAEREDLARRLAAIPGVRTWPSSANFCLIEVPDGQRVVQALRAGGIAVRPAASFPGLRSSHIRVTARDPAANARLARALSEAVAACSRPVPADAAAQPVAEALAPPAADASAAQPVANALAQPVVDAASSQPVTEPHEQPARCP